METSLLPSSRGWRQNQRMPQQPLAMQWQPPLLPLGLLLMAVVMAVQQHPLLTLLLLLLLLPPAVKRPWRWTAWQLIQSPRWRQLIQSP